MQRQFVGLPILCALFFSMPSLGFAEDTTTNPVPAATHSTQSPACDNSCICHKDWQDMAKTLQLDQTQRDQIKSIKDSTKTSIKGDWKQLKAVKQEMKTLITADSIDQTKLDALIQQKTTLMGSILKTKILMKNQIYHVLNDKQKQQFQALMNQWDTHQVGRKHCQMHF